MSLLHQFDDQKNPYRGYTLAVAAVAAGIALVVFRQSVGSLGQNVAGFLAIAVLALGLAICGLLQKRYTAWEAEHEGQKKRKKRPHKKH